MNPWFRLPAAVGLIAALTACAPAPPDLEAEKAALMQTSRDWALAAAGFSVSWEPGQASISAQGDVGYLIEKSQFTFTDANGVLQTQHGKSVTVWRKNADGEWKCVVDTWNNNPPEKALAGAAPG